jgi:hypothetical protein
MKFALTAAFLAAALAAAGLASAQDEGLGYAPAFEAARAAYAKGQESGISPQTRGEYLTCAGHWQALHQFGKGAMLTQEDFEALGPKIDGYDHAAQRTRFLDLYGSLDSEEAWDKYQRASSDAMDQLAWFREGDAAAAEAFFETLGTCDTPAQDFSAVTSKEEIAELANKGLLVPVYLFPPSLGGPEIEQNQVYVTPEAARNMELLVLTIERFVADGLLNQMDVQPAYRGDSLVPSKIAIKAWNTEGDGRFEPVIEVW